MRKTVTVKTSNVRLFLIDRVLKKYRIIFTSGESFNEGYIQINIAGEDGRLKAKLQQAILEITEQNNIINEESKSLIDKIKVKLLPEVAEKQSSNLLKVEGNKILLRDIISNKKIRLSFILDYSEACSLEVKFYGYQK